MPVTVRSFAKINLGLCIGALRSDGYHELRTVYQTVALHDVLRIQVRRGSGIEIRCADPRVPADRGNTCYRIVEHAMAALQARGRVVIEIEKRLPVQGGLGGASANAVAALLGLEKALRKSLGNRERLRIAAEIGSDLPLFLVGGTVLGLGRGQQVYPLPDLPAVPCVVAVPPVGVSTPQAFADWDRAAPGAAGASKLTQSGPSARMEMFGHALSAWLSGASRPHGRVVSGAPARGRGRAETLLLDLDRTGIENDFEKVVFPQYPELGEVKRALLRAGAAYASLSGSGSAVYGLFRDIALARKAARLLREKGTAAAVTTTLTRAQYWRKLLVSSF